jgi:hypothetical protein
MNLSRNSESHLNNLVNLSRNSQSYLNHLMNLSLKVGQLFFCSKHRNCERFRIVIAVLGSFLPSGRRSIIGELKLKISYLHIGERL